MNLATLPAPYLVLPEQVLGPGKSALVLARAGAGKTGLILQHTLAERRRSRSVLHITLEHTLSEVRSWYEALEWQTQRMQGDRFESRRETRWIVSLPDGQIWPARLETQIERYFAAHGKVPDVIWIDGFSWSKPKAEELAASILNYAKSLQSELWLNASAHAGDQDLSREDGRQNMFNAILWMEPCSQWTELRLAHWQGAPQTTMVQLCSDTLEPYESPRIGLVRFPPTAFTLLSGGAKGAEAEFGRCAEAWTVREMHFSFAGRSPERKRGVVELSEEELSAGAVSETYMTAKLRRQFPDAPLFRKMLQSIWHQVATAGEVFCIGTVQADQTVKGGTGWAVELARIWNKPVHVFDQDAGRWLTWRNQNWQPWATPKISALRFCGTGTRFLSDSGQRAIEQLYSNTFRK